MRGRLDERERGACARAAGALLAEIQRAEAGQHRLAEFGLVERQREFGVASQRGDDAQFGVGQGVEAVEPDRPYAGKSFARDAFRRRP